MAKALGPVSFAFNRGLVSSLALARIDLERARNAAELMTNWVPRVLGPMMLRPGMQYIGATASNGQAKCLPFVFGVDDYAHLELTASLLRVRVDDELITREAVTAAVTNGGFDADVSGWTDADESGGTSQWQTGGYLALLGDGTNSAIRRQQVTVTETDTEHALRVVVARGPVLFRVGSSAGAEDYVAETRLGTGEHSLAFTPSGDFHIQVSSARDYTVLVDSITVEDAGVMTLPTPWAVSDFDNIRREQSGDVIYLCDGENQQRKIERRATRSWSVVLYEPEDGPFRGLNTSNITLSPSALNGDVVLTASKSLFRTDHVGALFRISSRGQDVEASISAEDTFSDPIRVTGVEEGRRFGIVISGSFTATVTVQYSVGEPGAWVDLSTTYSSPVSTSYLDNQDNQIIYYRIGVKAGDFSSGPVSVALNYAAGSIDGIARITEYTSGTEANAVVLQDFGSTDASSDWYEGAWSDYRGWPSAVSLFEGRVWFAGQDKIDGSISDAYESFDDTYEGDAGPVSRSIGEGPIENIHWLLSLGRLLVGTASNSARIAAAKIDGNNILAARSSSYDEPLTPTNFALKNTSARGVFVDRSRQRLFELMYSIQSNDYEPGDLSLLVPDLNEDAAINGIAVQMKPDVRVHCWRADGTIAILVFDRAENVICWVEHETDGEVEDVSVLPGVVEDQVYYVVKRVIDGSTVRYIEKWALESECQGGLLNKQADSFVVYDSTATTTITGLSHLEGETVVVWADGEDVGEHVVASGQISLDTAASKVVVGLPYTAQWKSVKPAFGEDYGVPLNQVGAIGHIGFVLKNTHAQGLQFGPSFDYLDDLPAIEDGAATESGAIWTHFDKKMIEFPGEHTTDPRVCLQAAAPRPCTVLSCIVTLDRSNR